MSKALSIIDTTALAEGQRTDHPVAVYLAGLSAGSRRTMLGALNTITQIACSNRTDAWAVPWAGLRHQLAAAVTAFSPARTGIARGRDGPKH